MSASEDFFFDKTTGVKLNANMFDYKKVTMPDMPPVDMKLLETRVGNAAYGSNGISHSLANTHLVVCAIQNAIGKWVDPPATPDKVIRSSGQGISTFQVTGYRLQVEKLKLETWNLKPGTL